MAEITQVFTRPRRTFGRHCVFDDVPATLLCVVPRRSYQYIDGFRDESNDFKGDVRWSDPDAPLDDLWIYPRETVSCFDTSPSMSATEYNGVSGINTDRAESRESGMAHTEGGWPENVDPDEAEDVQRLVQMPKRQ